MKILIFGTGFIATNLIDYLMARQVEVVVMYNHHKVTKLYPIRQVSMACDIEKLFLEEQFDHIVMLHGNSFVPNNVDIKQSIKDNVFMISNMLETMYHKKLYTSIRKMLIIGSASEYGKLYNEPIKEDFPLHPTSIYGLSKILLFNTAKFFIERGFPIVYVRQFNAAGIGQRADFVMSAFIQKVIAIEKGQHEPVLDIGDVTQERDFIDVRDACRAYRLLLERGNIGEVYNVGSGEYVSIETLLDRVIVASTLSKERLCIDANPEKFSIDASLSKRLHANIDKLKALGFERRYSMQETIRDTMAYWREADV
jgi:GDP-4-dehydro-6-deoxy-D-mannose reductase